MKLVLNIVEVALIPKGFNFGEDDEIGVKHCGGGFNSKGIQLWFDTVTNFFFFLRRLKLNLIIIKELE
jgi:hypothetical protein